MLSNKQLMLRPSCQPEWGKKGWSSVLAKGKWQAAQCQREEGAGGGGTAAGFPLARGAPGRRGGVGLPDDLSFQRHPGERG